MAVLPLAPPTRTSIVADAASPAPDRAVPVALAWVRAQGSDVIPIPGSSRRTHLRDNLAALDLHLAPSDLDEIDAAVPGTGAHGARYSEHSSRLIDS